MRIISHRGNLSGPNSQYENTICYLDVALDFGYDVEVDVRYADSSEFFFLGHDKAIKHQTVPMRFFENPKVWAHCKDKKVYKILSKNPLVNCFMHGDENYVKTSRGNVWVHSRWSPGNFIMNDDISDVSEDRFIYTWFIDKECPHNLFSWNFDNVKYGICSDYVESYKER